MPKPAMENPVNTPIAYNGTRPLTVAPNTSSSESETTVSTTMPFENTNRWPRLVSQRGRNESPATKLARNGNPLKLVLPPVNRMSAVAACTTKYMKWADCPNMTSASWASTVGYPASYGIAWVMCANQEIPAIRNATIDPWRTRICLALRPSGGRSTLTALETASMPVSEEPPLAK